MTGLVDDARAALCGPGRAAPVGHAVVPATPGLYAVFAEPSRWVQLNLAHPPDDRPLYVGKSERSLNSRDVRTHFATGKTGSSTLRRSLAALLVDALDLSPHPRNPALPGALRQIRPRPDGDARLTTWMLTNLRLAIWPLPAPGIPLGTVETGVLQQLQPPLNLSKVRTPWRQQIQAARRQLARQAKDWEA